MTGILPNGGGEPCRDPVWPELRRVCTPPATCRGSEGARERMARERRAWERRGRERRAWERRGRRAGRAWAHSAAGAGRGTADAPRASGGEAKQSGRPATTGDEPEV